ncbi:MAG TPA: TolC family protein [Methylococcaceae bacterium]|nr:TolC family protein [Methylococcaceae bacterium]
MLPYPSAGDFFSTHPNLANFVRFRIQTVPVLAAVFLMLLVRSAFAMEAEPLVAHVDELSADPALSLQQLVEETAERYPKQGVAGAMAEEARALQRRGESLFPGYPSLYLQWIDDSVGQSRGVRQVQTGIQLPLWMWGQRAAGKDLAGQAAANAAEFGRALRHEVAGLVREALWDIALAENRLELARRVHEVSQRLVDTIRLRVEVGDLARADLLLAESDHLEKRASLTDAEAELMHARQAFINLTRASRAPARFEEPRSRRAEISADHPTLAAAGAAVERLRAEVGWVKESKQGAQPTVTVGTQHDWFERGQARDDETNLIVQVPFGGGDYNAPVEAEANLRLNQAMAEREQLARDLEKALHEAEHHLQVDEAQLANATERRQLAERHLEISHASFDAGEMELLDLLKIESAAQKAIRDAEQTALQFKRDVARYNQVVGEMP